MGVLNHTTAEINDILTKVDNMPESGTAGKTPVLETGETVTLSAGDSATSEVVHNGEDASGNPKYKLNFGIPRGKDGTGSSGGGTADSVDWDKVLNKPSWINSGTKPVYTASEVGALPAGIIIPSKVSELDNDSKFVKQSEMKTVNGNSLIGKGNIEIVGSGGGIADAPNDGLSYVRKDGTWSPAEMVNVADIIASIVDNTIPQENIDRLNGYLIAGKLLFITMEGTNVALTAMSDESQVLLMATLPYGNSLMRLSWTIDLATGAVIAGQDFIPDTSVVAKTSLLNEYVKASAYSAISDSDTINTAIGKLESGLANGNGGGGNPYALPSAILNLTDESAHDEIIAALGGSAGLDNILNSIKTGRLFYVSVTTGSLISSIPVSISGISLANIRRIYISYNTGLAGLSTYNEDTPRAYNISITGTTSNLSLKKKISYINGYVLNSSLYMLNSNSSSSEISTAVGGEKGMKNIIKAAEDGNRFVITGTIDLTKIRTEVSVMYSEEENGNISLAFSGVGYGIFGSALGGLLMLTFDKTAGTFSATSIGLVVQ